MSNVAQFAGQKSSAARAAAKSDRLSYIYLVGRMRAIGADGTDMLPKSNKAQALLAYFCLARGERLSRSYVAGVIWDRTGESQARDSLRHCLYELERAGWRLERDHESVRLDLAGIWIDALESPYRSDLLLDSLRDISPSFDQWLAGERARLEVHWQSLLEAELEELVNTKTAPTLRAEVARKLLNLVETHEAAVRHLMAAFVDMGERAAALREYERFRLTLNASLGILPSEKTVALCEAIRLRSRLTAARPTNVAPPTDEPAVQPACEMVEPSAPRAGAATAERGFEPSIAVLPFRNLTGWNEKNYVAEGLGEDLIEALSRLPSLFVISRLSAAAFRKQDRSPREVGEALGVRYVISGSVRVAGERLRLNVELSDASTNAALWRTTLDERFSDLFEVQDRLAETVVGSVAPHLRSAEIKRIRIKRPEDHDAYDLFLRGQETMHSLSPEVFESAKHLFESAIAREPQYAAALAWLAHWHLLRVGQGWSHDPSLDTAQADYFARRAVECDANEALAIAVQGHVAAYLHKDFVRALACFENALHVNRSAARAWLWRAYTHGWMGEGSLAVEDINRAMALAPYDPLPYPYSGGASLAYIADGQYARAIEFSLRSIRENPRYTAGYKSLIVALVLSDREAEARSPVNQLRLLEPGFTVEQFRRRSPASAGPRAELYCEAFAKAGVPVSD